MSFRLQHSGTSIRKAWGKWGHSPRERTLSSVSAVSPDRNAAMGCLTFQCSFLSAECRLVRATVRDDGGFIFFKQLTITALQLVGTLHPRWKGTAVPRAVSVGRAGEAAGHIASCQEAESGTLAHQMVPLTFRMGFSLLS